MKHLFYTLLGVALSATVSAGGYRVSLQGQKALAMGHTGVALSDSAEVIFFNPGAMTQLKGETEITGGLALLTGTTIYQSEETQSDSETENPLGTPINGYFSQKVSDELSWGLGIYTPYGNVVEWPTDWQGSHLVNKIELKTIYIQPTIGYQINDSTSIGFGPNLVIGSVNFNRNLSTSLVNADGDRSNVTIDDSGVTAWGYNFGVLHKLSQRTALGFSYRSEVTLEARDGDADFENIPTALEDSFPDGKFDADLVLPAELTIGISHKVGDKLIIAFDINRTFWSAFEDLTVEFEAPGAGTSVNPRNYEDSNIYRFGLQFRRDDKWTFRGGIYKDESPVPSGSFEPITPRNDSLGWTAGASYQYSKNLELDFSLLILTFDEIDESYDFYEEGGFDIPFSGSYESAATSLGFGLSYQY
jgi:long-chain fatty acid transport protein